MRNFLQRLLDLWTRPSIHMEKRYYYNGKPATPEQQAEMDRAVKEMDDWLKKLDEEFKIR